jgi:hypothetical protein
MRRSSRHDHRQLPLPFDAPLWNGVDLAAALRRECDRPLQLTFTENRSVLVSFSRRKGAVHLRLHSMFLHAPMEVVKALARSVCGGRGVGSTGVVRRFMNANLHRVRCSTRRPPVLLTEGRVHDLTVIRDRLNDRFFDGKLTVPVTWGRGGGRARRGRLTFGSYDPVLRLIRIHPVLDRRDVPLYFIESVLYHEMLHHQLGGVPDGAGRTIYHSRAFREAEARFPRQREALSWEKENIAHLLRVSQRLDAQRRLAPTWARKPARRSTRRG